MSLINKRLKEFRGANIERKVSVEEKEVKEKFPELGIIDGLELANEYRMWKRSIEYKDCITIDDFFFRRNEFKRRSPITKELTEKAKQSIIANIIIPKQ